ncbi:MAG TPA: lactonase family protein [Saprospiraceae bacterium]|nr:lactonase family protein [Saprospiraceae bacterium]
MKYKWILAILSAMLMTIGYSQDKPLTYLFVGSYTAGMRDTGIYVYTFDVKSGALRQTSFVDDIINPSYLTLSHDGQFLYSCADTKLPDTGSVMAFSVNAVEGKLSFINRQSSEGDNPVYVSVHPNNRYLINANYSGGSVSAYVINDNGSLQPASQVIPYDGSSIIPSRQEKAHIHAAEFSPNGDYVFLPDLGSDKIWVCRFDETRKQPLMNANHLTKTTAPGSGPRHFTFHPNEKVAYCIEELSGTVRAYAYHEGKLDELQHIFTYSKPGDFYWSADIHISPDGNFLYASNRREDENTIAIFAVDQQTGRLTLVGHQKTFGDHPRNFTIDPTGKYLLVANMLTNNIVVFKRNLKTGLLKKTKHEVSVPSPSCLKMRRY